MEKKQGDNSVVLVQQYRSVMAMIQQNYARRTATNRFYTSIGSGLLVFLTYVTNPSVDVEVKTLALTMVAVLGLILCLSWSLQIRTLRDLIEIQIKLTHEMERDLPFNFFGRQEELLNKPSLWPKHGAIEQALPFVVAIPYLVILATV